MLIANSFVKEAVGTIFATMHNQNISRRRNLMKINLIYITAGTMEEARTIANVLVSDRLAACVNIVDKISSIYWWEGKIQDEKEVLITAKTKESLVPELIDRVKLIHSYTCPCIVSMPIIDGNSLFLDWVANETKGI